MTKVRGILSELAVLPVIEMFATSQLCHVDCFIIIL